MSAVYLVVVGVMALSLASFAWAIHKAETAPPEPNPNWAAGQLKRQDGAA